MSVLPQTTADALEDELAIVHRVPRITHDWQFAANDVNETAVQQRILANIGWSDAYTWLDSKLKANGPPLWQQFNALSATLFDAAAVRSRMVSASVRQMHRQLTHLGGNATSADVLRVNRLIIEELFPDAVDRAEARHLRETLVRLREVKSSALCLSGGGIRSATFALGVLQGLSRAGDSAAGRYPIEEIDYLSTVSGGGYIGGWLSAWIARVGGKASAVFEELRKPPGGAIAPEAAPVRWLRDYSNYLAPRFSLFSVDTATLIATWARNVLINWLIFLPFLALLMLVPRLMASVVAQAEPSNATLLAGTLLTTLAVALIASARPTAVQQHDPARLRRIAVARLSIFAAALLLPLFWAGLRYDNVAISAFLLFGLVVQVAGASWHLARHGAARRAFKGVLAAAVVSGIAGGFGLFVLTRVTWLRPPIRWPEIYALVAPPAFVLAFLLAATTYSALSRAAARDEVHEYWNRLGASLMIGAAVYFAVAAISFYAPVLLAMSPRLIAAVGGITGLVGILLGWSGISPAGEREDLGRTAADRITAFLIPVFVVILMGALSWGLSAIVAWQWPGEFPAAPRVPPGKGLVAPAIDHLRILRMTPVGDVAMMMTCSALIALVASYFADVNKFSMHELYRMRLVRAYLGASNPERNPDPFTGFDVRDSVLLSELDDQKPLHVVNMALNLVRGRRLAWQQRKASTFTASPLHWGNWKVGYRNTLQYGKSPAGLDLGTAMTISGAAASPNMGYHSSPPLSFLLAMFNVRLGAWLGNPGAAGGKRNALERLLGWPPAWQRRSPKFSLAHQLAEAFGLTDDDHQYVYLSDGGHFENLGLYEMVLRRCRYIIVSDAGADPDLHFEDLGNAVRKIRIDFGVPIEFRRFAMVSREEKQPGAHCAIGRICYSAVDGTPTREDGYLLYLKASYYAVGPQDVRQYAMKVRRFPHESTADQFFTESQFESYRKLGEWVIDSIMGGSKPQTMRALFAAARRYERRHKEVERW